jgi:hypothetical protein
VNLIQGQVSLSRFNPLAYFDSYSSSWLLW